MDKHFKVCYFLHEWMITEIQHCAKDDFWIFLEVNYRYLWHSPWFLLILIRRFCYFSASINAVPRVFLASNFLRKHGLRIMIVLQTKEDGIRFNYRYKTCVKNKTLGTDWTTNIMTVKCVKSMNNNTSYYYLDLMFIFLFMAQ